MGSEVFHNLKKVLHERGLSTAVGDEGGFAPALNGTEDAIESIIEAIKRAGYKPGRKEDGGDVAIAWTVRRASSMRTASTITPSLKVPRVPSVPRPSRCLS